VIGQRHDQQDADGVAGLRSRRHPAGAIRRQVKIGGDGRKQRLAQVHIGYRDAGGGGQYRQLRPGRHGCTRIRSAVRWTGCRPW
jgi:hypothetical protein